MATELVCLLDRDGRLRGWNQSLLEFVDRSPDELLDQPIDTLVTDDDVATLSAGIDEAIESGSATLSATFQSGQQEYQPYQVRITRLDADGTDAEALTMSARSVSERVDALREREAILDRMTDAFFALDEEWRLTYVNDRARRILSEAMTDDFDADSLIGVDFWEAIPDAVGTIFYEQYQEAMQSQEPVSFEGYYEPMETWFQVHAYPSATGLSVYFRDITQRRQQREALQSREEVLREMHDVVADADRSFEEQVEALMTLGREFLDTEYATLSRIDDDAYVFEAVQSPNDAIEPGDTVPLDITNCERVVTDEQTLSLGDISAEAPALADREGNKAWDIQCYLGAPVFVDDEIYGTFCFYGESVRKDSFSDWDVTLVDLMARWIGYELDHQRTHEQLKRQNERLEDFTSIVSHDLRNPLNVVRGSIELAEETGDQEQFDRAYRTINRMERLIDDLLILAREGDTIDTPETVDLAELIDQCWNLLETETAELHVATDRSIKADPGRLRQLLENLIDNAIVHGGKSVTVTVGDLDDGFYIEDDGPGIPESEREQVFDAGYTTADDGTGFGLRIVKEIAEAHRWTVTVTEGADGGARFEITGVDVV
ncbi:MAG: ATP-binding protein [Halobacteriales archaeon]